MHRVWIYFRLILIVNVDFFYYRFKSSFLNSGLNHPDQSVVDSMTYIKKYQSLETPKKRKDLE